MTDKLLLVLALLSANVKAFAMLANRTGCILRDVAMSCI
jgi:hypothetical protein